MIDQGAIAEYNASHETVRLEAIEEENALAVWMQPSGRACFSLDLLSELTHVQVACQAGRFGDFDAWMLGSLIPDVFNYGGDIELFAEAIRSRNRRLLQGYGRLCINLVHQHRIGFGLPITTVALIQGDALGGGAEGALSAQVVVAEKGHRIAFPEIMFNLFPGMGAFHILADRLGVREAEQLLIEGRFHTTEEFHELGLVDVLAEPGEGLLAAREYLAKAKATANGRLGLAATRSDLSTLTYESLGLTVDRWVDRALDLGPDNLKLIDHLVGRQHAKTEAG